MNDQRITARETQRVIKFRAWDGNEMHYKLSYIGNGTERGNSVMAAEKPLINAVLMQFTGLLDKHGKEIYEGDILKFVDHKHETRHIGPVVWGRYEMSVFDIPTWTAKNGNRGGIGLFPVNFKKPVVDMEVVGNIYSNPELVDPKMIEHGNS